MTQRYDTYKDSGVQWLGNIPGHWGCVPVRRIAHVNPTRTKNLEADSYVGYAPMEKIRCDKMNPSKIKVSKLTSGLTYCEEGDIVLAKVTPCFENGNLARVPHVEQGCCYASSELFVFRAKDKVLPRFLFSTFRNRGFINAGASTMRGTGGLKRVTTEFANSAATPLPPLSEQNHIVSYLDEKCRKIDEWLDKKQNEVENLQELKQRAIADAVTRGLNPNVSMKQTNIPWLPEVPEHWMILRAKHMFNKEQRPIEDGDDIVTCFRDGEVTLRKNRRITGFTEATDYSHYQHICKGDLVIHQMDAFAGSAGVSDSDGMGTPVLSVCTPKSNNILNEYYAHIVRLMGKNGFILSLYRGIRERSSDFRFDTFANLWLPVPPIEEQKQIVTHITEKTSKIDKLIANINKEIDGIKEFKQRLISDVVTGQIKVC